MATEDPNCVRMWSFHRAPREFQRLFPEGADSDWVAQVPGAERHTAESSMLQWRTVFPVRRTEFPDGSIVYFGAPSQAINMIAGREETVSPPPLTERRAAARIHLECPSRYQTSIHVGSGHTIDMSRAGIAFTTETLLPSNAEVTLHVTWPVRLEGDVPVFFRASGEVVRVEPMKAAMRVDRLGFSVEE